MFIKILNDFTNLQKYKTDQEWWQCKNDNTLTIYFRDSQIQGFKSKLDYDTTLLS